MVGSCIESDVLVVGGGLAGMRAAIEASSLGATVVLVLKEQLGRSGSATSAFHGAGVGPWAVPEDSKELHLKDVIRVGGYLADQELCKIMIDEVPDRLIELERFGLCWERKADGSIDPYLGAQHSAPRTISTLGRKSGLQMLKALEAWASQQKIRALEYTAVTNLLTRDGTVVGATGLNYLTGEFMCFKAKSTVVTTGASSRIFPECTTPPECTGDGQAMAYRVGAELRNMEQVLYVSCIANPPAWRGILVPTLYKIGDDILHLLNKNGERYMERYDPENLEMASKDLIARASYTEVKEGRGGEGDILYADFRHLPYEDMKKKLGDIVSCMEERGLSAQRDLVEFRLAAHETLGGIKINSKCESTVPGLYAAGSVISAVYGNDGITGRGTGHALVFGKRAGEYAGKRALEISTPSIELEQVEKERARVFKLLDNREGITPIRALKHLQQIMGTYFWLTKNEAGLKKALGEILSMRKKDLPRLSLSSNTTRYNLEWRYALELSNMVDASEMMVRSAMVRKESRTSFLRDDYPEEDNANWLKHVVVKRQNGEMTVSTAPIELTYVRPRG